MKKMIVFALTLTIIIPIITQSTVSLAEEKEKLQASEISEDLYEIVEKYDDGNYIPEIILDKADGVKIKGDNFTIPSDVLLENCAEDINVPKKSKSANIDYAEKLGYEVSIDEDEVTLSQPYQTHRLIVKGRDIDKLDSLEIIPFHNGMYIVQFDDLESTLHALDYYNEQDNIEFASPDAVVSLADNEKNEIHATAVEETTNSTSWGSAAIGFNTAFKARMGLALFLPTVKVAVVDTGISPHHEQLKNRVIETGYNISDSYAFYGTEYDDNGHGTHVAGIIAQNTLSNVKILGFKVLNRAGAGTSSQVMDGLYAAHYAGCKVINLSLGGVYGVHMYDPGEYIYNFLYKNNITCCVAAGNDGKDCSVYAPAQYYECITVAAMDENYEIPEWSNFGKKVDIIAPGVNISSAYYLNDKKYIELSGTSMATPFVTAAAANVLSKNPEATPQKIKEFLQINGRDINAPEHFYGKPALYLGNIRSFNMYEKPEAPTYSLEEGEYKEGTKLKINKTGGSDIYYQIYDYDKSDNEYKLTSKTKYTGEIILDRPCVIVAIASYKGFLDSDINQSKFYVKYASDEGRFSIDENGTITAYTGNSADLVIPESINGVTVKAIGASVFSQLDVKEIVNTDEYSNYLRTVTLPETCTAIDNYAFFGCKYLKDVCGGNIKTVGYCAFSNCISLSSIDISNVSVISGNSFSGTNIRALESEIINTIEDSCLNGCKSLQYVNLPNVKSIGIGAFSGSSLINAELSNVSEISEGAFYKCEGMENIMLSNSLKNIGRRAFQYCYSLSDIYFNGTKREWDNIKIESQNEPLKSATIHFLTYDSDCFTLLSAINETKEYTNSEYTRESLESLNAIADKYASLVKSGVDQEKLDAATAEILNAIISLDSLSNYNITSFDGKEIELTNNDGNKTELTFSDFVNKKCESLDVVDDGVVNAKDYAFLMKNY